MIGSLHDLSCSGPTDCTCTPIGVPKPSPVLKEPKPLKAKVRAIPLTEKRAAFERYGYTCQWCFGLGGALDAHHIQRRSQGGLDKAENLRPVHRACHRFIHEHPAEAKARGLLA